ncbi:MAG: OmpA/MotB family protein, partial [Bacteroidota bacterium]
KIKSFLDDSGNNLITTVADTVDRFVQTKDEKDKAIQDNWDLSVKRATAVIRILMDNSNIEGERIIAAGRSKHLPLEPNDSDASKRKNRRTEIILTPKLDELLEILNTN